MHVLLPGLSSAPNLHPVAVHFPITLWLLATGFWIFALVRADMVAWKYGVGLHWIGALGGLVAVGLGFWAAESLGHNSPGHDLVHVHRNIMLAASVLSVTLCFLSLGWPPRTTRHRLWFLGLSVVLSCLTVVGADKGGELVYRFGMGVDASTATQTTDAHSHEH